VTVALVFSLSLLAACVSLREPQSDNDTALIVPVLQGQEAGFNAFGHYTVRILGMSDQKATLLTIDDSTHYDLLYGLPPGKYSVVETTFVYNDGRKSSPWNPDISFELEPKRLTILEKIFVSRKYYNGSILYMQGRWDPLTQSSARDLLDDLWKDESFRKWKLSDASMANPTIQEAYEEVSGVRPAQPAGKIALNKTGLSLFQGSTGRLTATVTPSDISQALTGSSSDPSIATVDSSGLVSAAAAGLALITAGSGGATATCWISVWAPDGDGYLQFKADNPSAKGGWWNKSFPGDDSLLLSANPVTVSMKKVSGMDIQGFGFLYCFQDDNNFYRILINTKSQFIVQKCQAGSYTTLVPWTASSALQKGFMQVNKVSVAQPTRDSFVVTFNDDASRQVSYSDPAFSAGRVMLYVTVGLQEDFPSAPEDVRFKIMTPVAYP
jgi:hypothetical protein